MIKKDFGFGLRVIALLIAIISSHAFAMDDTAIKVKWGYKGAIGPAHWGSLSPAFVLCATGKSQSPINVNQRLKKAWNPLVINYHPAPMIIMDDGITSLMIGKTQTLINDGHGVQVNFPTDEPETIVFNSHTYRLVQFHIHTPSENKLHEEAFPMEIHFVHQGDQGDLAVIGVLVKHGEKNMVLQKIIDHMPKEKGKAMMVKDERINPKSLLPSNYHYYYFMGSLTTPPCAEGVEWIVMADQITASPQQMAALKKAAGGANARPVQPLNGRVVSFVKAKA